MVLNIRALRNIYILECTIAFTTQLQSLILGTMEESITEQVTKLLQRLTEAERRAKLLKCEIQDIRTQISNLTKTANSILNERSVTNSGNILRSAQALASCSITGTKTLKRQNEETDTANENNTKRNRGDIPMENGYVVAYTDGACENNGKPNARAGIGVWFSDGHYLNISEPVKGRATNNTAEIQAPTEALKVLKGLGYDKVKIITDSQFTINCITQWIKKWKKNQWKLAGGGPVKNKEDLVKLDNLCEQFQDVKWEYCAGHKGIRGNEEADKLARQGAVRYKP